MPNFDFDAGHPYFLKKTLVGRRELEAIEDYNLTRSWNWMQMFPFPH